ncbi:arsenosugar biosynthesis radical SAM (seleno)protein ArsS [Poriferisphaera sp. WC338]|uniref:arsenosugar biosynthesis radical SAM (seleno)protein ArsS n=1 Tax=Poriferisphaera sp. WC338 TaxID=3425129 RepID=UPI003D81268F
MTQTVHLPISEQPNLFGARLAADGQQLLRDQLTTLQINVGKMCNLACHHCHVEAGPSRTEIMTRQTMQRILDWYDAIPSLETSGNGSCIDKGIATVDLTGGAPEMNPDFKWFVTEIKKRGLHVIDRCNLTILLEPGYEGMAEFLAEHEVEISASLPCYLQDNVDKQRGKGVFDGSIHALQKLNELGYGKASSNLRLDLVYNPVGYGLPSGQMDLEKAYKQRLHGDWGIEFNQLWTITNMPIKRFEHALRRDGEFDGYMEKLQAAHSACNVSGVMCRSLVSVGWQGSVYDCDFNQMLQMPLEGVYGEEHVVESQSKKLWQYTVDELIGRHIKTGSHCFGCTAGAGSSCTGALS